MKTLNRQNIAKTQPEKPTKVAGGKNLKDSERRKSDELRTSGLRTVSGSGKAVKKGWEKLRKYMSGLGTRGGER